MHLLVNIAALVQARKKQRLNDDRAEAVKEFTYIHGIQSILKSDKNQAVLHEYEDFINRDGNHACGPKAQLVVAGSID